MGDYDKFAKTYEEQTEALEEKLRQNMHALFPSLNGLKVLDVGCGSGQDATYYVTQGAQVYGIDISKEEVQMANKKVKGEFRVGTMNALPYENNQFDVVASVYALQASDDVPKALTEMVRVAKPGAPIIIATKHPIRNLLESHVNDKNGKYFEKRTVTSHIFSGKITLREPGHTLSEYLNPQLLSEARLEKFEEHNDFPASAQVIEGMDYPTYMIMKFVKKQA